MRVSFIVGLLAVLLIVVVIDSLVSPNRLNSIAVFIVILQILQLIHKHLSGNSDGWPVNFFSWLSVNNLQPSSHHRPKWSFIYPLNFIIIIMKHRQHVLTLQATVKNVSFMVNMDNQRWNFDYEFSSFACFRRIGMLHMWHIDFSSNRRNFTVIQWIMNCFSLIVEQTVNVKAINHRVNVSCNQQTLTIIELINQENDFSMKLLFSYSL